MVSLEMTLIGLKSLVIITLRKLDKASGLTALITFHADYQSNWYYSDAEAAMVNEKDQPEVPEDIEGETLVLKATIANLIANDSNLVN